MIKKGIMIPPGNCVIIEMEKQVSLGYRGAVLLSEIQTCGSLAHSAETSKIDLDHAYDLILELNRTFSQPLVEFSGNPNDTDVVALTEKGKATVLSYWGQFEPVCLSIMEERSRHY
jgi:molybdate transport repressor ModE-like protein